ncbi:uncharacterized protein PRCAT00000360001 [Priceomyces carsonii]|uniref:uncharacterized protein n=1 Tax=Priceomyces carsonii TaxID=28549 RepID=UPI002EDBAFBB|nr:unnamed protein product [Priceomyces carsonii]
MLLQDPESPNKLHSMGHTTEEDSEINDLHPMELMAHSVLSGPLDGLNESFEQLSQSQLILLTRLRLIEERLTSFKKSVTDEGNMLDDKEVASNIDRIKDLTKRAGISFKTLSEIEKRVERMNQKLGK